MSTYLEAWEWVGPSLRNECEIDFHMLFQMLFHVCQFHLASISRKRTSGPHFAQKLLAMRDEKHIQ